MLILIRPYIIENDEDAYSLTRSQQDSFTLFDASTEIAPPFVAEPIIETLPEAAIVTPYNEGGTRDTVDELVQ